jgi:two-component system, sporulation sensor kinase D
MNLYSNKQRWKIFLFILAMCIVAITLWYSNYIADRIRDEEHKKVQLWSEAIRQRADLVRFTERLFDQLRDEERKRANLLAKGYSILTDPSDQNDLTFITDFIWSNTTIPILIYDDHNHLVGSANLPEGKDNDPAFIDSLFNVLKDRYPPIVFPEVGHKVYYNDSYLFAELQLNLDKLINTFLSETVMNSASAPVLLTDSSQKIVLRAGNVDSLSMATPQQLARKLEQMRGENTPIEIELPGQGKNYIFYEDSRVLKQLELFPVFQLILIGVFLLVSYLIFSTFRKAEQNQVWVGMAKETAHQLGTPLSSLMAWSSLLENQVSDKSVMVELNKDIERLHTITERFSKIGSVPELKEENLADVVNQALEYLRPRVSRSVIIRLDARDPGLSAWVNRPLFGWVLENLVRNAVDAMEGSGSLEAVVFEENGKAILELSDSGKGIPKNQWNTVFKPGFTTKKRGWGLGLSLARRIIDQYHEGKIFIRRSEPGKGTTFRIELRAV